MNNIYKNPPLQSSWKYLKDTKAYQTKCHEQNID